MDQICLIASLLACISIEPAGAFWDTGTTTFRYPRDKDEGRTSFFRWQFSYVPSWINRNRGEYATWDWDDVNRRRRTSVVAGLSIDWQSITTGAILNRRSIITSANALYPHMPRQYDVRIWTAGIYGRYNTPFRYRVYRIHLLFPRSGSREHCHGQYCVHQPRHDVAIVISKDQMYLYDPGIFYRPYFTFADYFFPVRCRFDEPHNRLIHPATELWYAGSGFEYITHIHENYKIFWRLLYFDDLVDCSRVLPKWWGKFVCLKNWQNLAGLQNGGPFFLQEWEYKLGPAVLVGLGCFEIRYNDDRVFVFTDLRYYYYRIQYVAGIAMASYYEYAYPQWMAPAGHRLSLVEEAYNPYPPITSRIKDDLMILG